MSVDITDLVSKIKLTWIQFAMKGVMTIVRATPWLSWLGWPVISQIFEFFLERLITLIADGIEMEAFFFNTALRKANQAKDFIAAIQAKDALPQTASYKEFYEAEQRQMVAFRSLVVLTD